LIGIELAQARKAAEDNVATAQSWKGWHSVPTWTSNW
jgi:hypothetical protein